MYKILEHLTSPKSVAKAVTNPRRAYRFLKYTRYDSKNPHKKRKRLQGEFDERNWTSSLSGLLDINDQNLEAYIEEFESEVRPHVESCRERFRNKPFLMGGVEVEAPILYSALRVISPDNVVEVGVANGVSSYYILSALEQNGNGNLISIDIPKYESEHTGEWHENAGAWIPEGEDAGWIVPNELKSNWELYIGDMNDKLPDIIENKNGIDGFVYDGPKSYKMRKEALSYVLEMGEYSFLFCDDIAWNPSFEHFASENSLEWETYGNVGIALIH